MFATFRIPTQPFKSAKEAFRWSLGLLGKCLARVEQAGRDRGELEYLRGIIGNSDAPESSWISPEYL